MTGETVRSTGSPLTGLQRTHRAAIALLFAASLLASPSTGSGAERDSGSAAGSRDASDLIQSVIDSYESADSYRIDFTQESYWRLADTLYITNGVLILERPLNMAISYEDGSRIVSNGESLWVYTAQTRQYFSTAVDSGDVVIDPPRLLTQYSVDANGRFPVPTRCRTTGPPESERAAVGLSLRPGESAVEPASLDVYVDDGTDTVIEIVAHSRSGDFTRYIISRTLFDIGIDPSTFDRIRPPERTRAGEAGSGR